MPRASALRPSVQALVRRLEQNELVSLSDYGPARMSGRAAAPQGLTRAEAEAIVDAACASTRLRVVSFRGTLMGRALHTHVLTHLAQRLPGSRIVCLNVGEFTDASLGAYRALVRALPQTYVGNLYWQDPDPTAGSGLKDTARAHLRANRRKDFYRSQLVDDALWRDVLRHGCKAWWNPQNETREISRALWADTSPTARCSARCLLRRCKGLNKQHERCCLCTRHDSGYCHHHR